MRTLVRSCLVMLGLGLLSALGGCRAPKRPARPVAAHVGQKAIFVDDVDKAIAADLFDLRSGVVHKLISGAVLEEEARKRGLTLQELWRAEVDQKVPTLDAASAGKEIDQWVNAGRITAEEAAKLAPEGAIVRVRDAAVMAREQAFFDGLYEKAAVQIDFAALGKPWLQISNDGPTLGPSNAPITIVEFVDLTQPFASMWQPTLEKLVARYGGKVRFLFKQKPAGPDSPSAKVAEGVLCANEQQRYWDFRKALFGDGKPVGPDSLAAAAAVARLDVGQFQQCLTSRRNKDAVAENMEEARANRLEGEPVLSVNGVRLTGAQPFDKVDKVLRNELETL
jgi:protein-disulfide isomerase